MISASLPLPDPKWPLMAKVLGAGHVACAQAALSVAPFGPIM